MALFAIALAINILVLTPVISGLLSSQPNMNAAFGPDQPARQILTSVYMAIWLLSACGLAALAVLGAQAMALIAPLLALQVVYKLIAVALVGLGNPVVVTNLVIALFHSAVLIAFVFRYP